MAAFSIAPAFASIPSGGPVIPLSTLKAALIAPNGDSTKRSVPFVGDSAVLAFEVPVAGAAVPFTLALSAFDVKGVVAFSAQQQITLHPGDNAITQTPLLVPDGPDAKVVALHVTPGPATIPALGSLALSVSGTTSNGQAVTPVRVGWTSKDPTIATVDQNGAVTAGQSQGSTFIVARAANGVADSISLKVRAPVDHIVLAPTTLSLIRGRTSTVGAELRDVTNHVIDDRSVSWSSSDATVASVSSTGVVTALKLGKANIIATSEGKSATVAVTVTTPVDHIELSPTPVQFSSLKLTFPLVAKLVPVAGATVDGLTASFSSANASIASVDANGVVTSLGNGATKITAQVDGLSASVDVSVAQIAVSVSVSPKALSVSSLTGTGAITATAVDANGSAIAAPKVTWTSSDLTIATVTGTGAVGTVKAHRAGSAQITATVDGKSDVSTFIVASQTAALAVTASASTVSVGQTVSLSAKFTDMDGNVLGDADARFTTSTPNLVAIVGNSAVGLAAGTAQITGTAGPYSGGVSLQVVGTGTEVGSDLIVHNDFNTFDDANGSSGGANQQRFYRNLVEFSNTKPRGSATDLLVYLGNGSLCNLGQACDSTHITNLTARLRSSGHEVWFRTTLDTVRASVKTILLMTPTQNFDDADLNTLKSFLLDGGRVVYVGDYGGYYGNYFGVENDFLQRMGSPLRTTTDLGSRLSCGGRPWAIPASSIRPYQLTAGLTGLSIPCAAKLIPDASDRPIFYDDLGTTVISAATTYNPTIVSETRIRPRVQRAVTPPKPPTVDGVGKPITP